MISIPSSKPLSNQSYAPWYYGEPNGDTKENCVEMIPQGYWNDVDCDTQKCVACHIPTYPVFVLRGCIKVCFF